MFIGVEIMMFVGFGYLMTVLTYYGVGAAGLTMHITAIGLQFCLFTESFWHQVRIIYLFINLLNFIYLF